MFGITNTRIREIEMRLIHLMEADDWLRDQIERLEKKLADHHDGSMNIIRQALGLDQDASIPDMVVTINRLRALDRVSHCPSHRLTADQIAQLDADV